MKFLYVLIRAITEILNENASTKRLKLVPASHKVTIKVKNETKVLSYLFLSVLCLFYNQHFTGFISKALKDEYHSWN